jgi:hypothetical protein
LKAEHLGYLREPFRATDSSLNALRFATAIRPRT